MKKSEINVCDNCRRVITENKCEICDRDICEDCEDDMGIGLANGGILFKVISCKRCSNKLEKARLKQYFDEKPHKELRRGIIKLLRTAIVVENLQDDDNETHADKRWLIDKINPRERETELNPWGTKTQLITPNHLRVITQGALTPNSKIKPFNKIMKGGLFKTKK